MKFVKPIVLVIISGLLFLGSICVILAGVMAFNHQFTSFIIHVITRISIPAYYILGGLIMLLASLIVYKRAGQPSDSSATFTFDGEKGPIDVSLRAIEDYLSKHFAEKPEIDSIRVRVGTSRDQKMLRMRATISVWSDRNLRVAGETLQREMTICLKEGLGLDNVESVAVSVHKIVPAKSLKQAPAETPADELP